METIINDLVNQMMPSELAKKLLDSIEELQSFKNEAFSVINEKTELLSQFEKENSTLKSQNESLDRKVMGLCSKIDEIEGSHQRVLKEKEKETKEALDDAEKNKRKAEKAEIDKELLVSRLEGMEWAEEQNKTKMDLAKQSLSTFQLRTKGLEAHLREMAMENQELEGKVVRLHETIKLLKEEVGRAAQLNEELKRKNEEMAHLHYIEMGKLHKEIQETKNKNKRLRGTLEYSKDKEKTYKSSLSFNSTRSNSIVNEELPLPFPLPE